MNLSYTTPFWIQDVSNSSWNLSIYSNTGSSSYGMTWTITVEYSTNGTTWSTFGTTSTTRGSYITKSFTAGQKVYLRCNTTHWGLVDIDASRFYYYNIRSSKNMKVGGNIMSLLYGTDFIGKTTFPNDTIAGIFNGLLASRTELTDASELVLPVTHATSALPTQHDNYKPLSRCYRGMFEGCTNLVNGPHIDLRARGDYDIPYCFQRMFMGCTSLMSFHMNTQAGNYRYNNMFSNNACAQGSICYDYSGGPVSSDIPTARMTRINIISMYLPTYDRVIDWEDGYGNTVNQVDDSNGDTIYLKNYSESEMKTPFYVQNINKQNETLTITQFEDVITNRRRVKYSYDNVTWSDLGITNYGTPLSLILHPSEKVYLKMNDYQDATQPCNNIMCRIDGVSKIGGNILSLAYGTLFTGKETATPYIINGSYWSTSFYFWSIFAESTNLVDASELILPSLSLYGNDYDYMFGNCTSLRYAPLSLPAVSAIKYPGSSLNPHSCYREMFYGCTSLETTPVIMCNETFMPDMCNAMFQGCTSLTKASNLYATTLTESCYGNMFRGCTSLTKAPDLYATTLADGCYGNMFQGCTSLTKAPDLNATTLTTQCYSGMFIGCSNLSYIKCLATDISAADCTSSWTNGVAANGTFVKDANTAWTTGVSGIPSGWTIQNN